MLGKIFNGAVQVLQFGRGQGGIGALVRLGHFDDERCRVDCGDGLCGREAGGGGREDAAAAAYVEVGES